MKFTLHKAEDRGDANHGWLHSRHSFSFANYFNPERMNFGALRVLNDDRVAAGMGFGTHPHKNMEIISIPLEGDLEHEDSMGNKTIIRNEDVQIMSAGTGVRHSEKNKNQDKEVLFLQIWVVPKELDIKPRYDQISLNPTDRKNKLQQVIAPEGAGEPKSMMINQDAWFYFSDLDAGKALEYSVQKEGNGIYLFILEGSLSCEEHVLQRRDALGIWEAEKINLQAEEASQILLMEVPML